MGESEGSARLTPATNDEGLAIDANPARPGGLRLEPEVDFGRSTRHRHGGRRQSYPRFSQNSLENASRSNGAQAARAPARKAPAATNFHKLLPVDSQSTKAIAAPTINEPDTRTTTFSMCILLVAAEDVDTEPNTGDRRASDGGIQRVEAYLIPVHTGFDAGAPGTRLAL